jgi:hypothetical protein
VALTTIDCTTTGSNRSPGESGGSGGDGGCEGGSEGGGTGGTGGEQGGRNGGGVGGGDGCGGEGGGGDGPDSVTTTVTSCAIIISGLSSTVAPSTADTLSNDSLPAASAIAVSADTSDAVLTISSSRFTLAAVRRSQAWHSGG